MFDPTCHALRTAEARSAIARSLQLLDKAGEAMQLSHERCAKADRRMLASEARMAREARLAPWSRMVPLRLPQQRGAGGGWY